MASRRARIGHLVAALRKQELYSITSSNLSAGDIERVRDAFEAQGTKNPSQLEKERRIGILPAYNAPCRAEWVLDSDVFSEASSSGSKPERVILYAHGGGFIAGSPRTHRGIAGDLAVGTEAAILNVEYRLAPENPFPAAAIDVAQCVRWLIDIGLPKESIAIAAESAGANICTSAMILLGKEHSPAASVLMSPFLNFLPGDRSGTSAETNRGTDFLCPDSLSTFGELYGIHNETGLREKLGYLDKPEPDYGGISLDEIILTSSNHIDLSSLPPTLIQAGGAEVILDDAIDMANRLGQQGVHVKLEVYPDMFHVFQLFPRFCEEASDAIESACSFLLEHVTATPSAASEIFLAP